MPLWILTKLMQCHLKMPAQGLYIPEGYDKQADNSATYNVTETVDGKDTIVKKTGVVVPKLKFDKIDQIFDRVPRKRIEASWTYVTVA